MAEQQGLAHWMRELMILRTLKHKEAHGKDITPEQEAACFWKAQADITALRKILEDIVNNMHKNKTRNVPEISIVAQAAHEMYVKKPDWDGMLSIAKQPGNLINAARKIAKQQQLSAVRDDKAIDVLTEHILGELEKKRGKKDD